MTVSTTFLSWLHKDINQTSYFLEITHEHGTITVTPEHYIFLYNGNQIFAGQLSVGASIRFFDQRGGSVQSKIISLEGKRFNGVYAPLTNDGNLIVDRVLFSNYAIVSKSSFGRIALFPFTHILPQSVINDAIVKIYVENLYQFVNMFFDHLI